MVYVQDAHQCPASSVTLFHNGDGGVENVHERNGTGRFSVCACHKTALRPQLRKVTPHSSSHFRYECVLFHRFKDLFDAVANGYYEARGEHMKMVSRSVNFFVIFQCHLIDGLPQEIVLHPESCVEEGGTVWNEDPRFQNSEEGILPFFYSVEFFVLLVRWVQKLCRCYNSCHPSCHVFPFRFQIIPIQILHEIPVSEDYLSIF